jgi:hypothetical protein
LQGEEDLKERSSNCCTTKQGICSTWIKSILEEVSTNKQKKIGAFLNQRQNTQNHPPMEEVLRMKWFTIWTKAGAFELNKNTNCDLVLDLMAGAPKCSITTSLCAQKAK